MAKVKIKTNNSNDQIRKHKLLEILAKNDIYATKIIPVPDGYVVLTTSETELDKLFNGKTDAELTTEGFAPQIPLELKAKRSVLIFKTDNHIFSKNEDQIKEELERRNEWVGSIQQIQKFPVHSIMKVTFDETTKASRAAEKGLLAFSMSLPKHDIKADAYYNINTCFRCYKMEDHTTNNCPKEKSYKICSNCSQQGHIWRDCKEKNKKCISCQGDHGTMEMRCPLRKEIINLKRNAGESNPTSYKEAAKHSMPNQAAANPGTITTEIHLTIFTCMLHAHFVNIANPGTYSTVLNKTLKLNDLPEIKIPDDPPSEQIIGAFSNEEKTSPPENQENQEMEVTNTKENEAQREELSKPARETKTTKQKKEKQTKATKGTDIGLKVYTPRTTGWPKGELTTKALVKGIQDNKYKFTYLDNELEEEDIINMINHNSIDLTDCFSVIEDSTYNKIRTGLTRQSTPPSVPHKRSNYRKNSF